MSPWGKYPVYKSIARFEYGRLLWKNPSLRQRMLAHGSDFMHPSHRRFLDYQEAFEEVLSSSTSGEELDRDLRKRILSLRVVANETPSVFVSIR
jgi:hypothetical protein